MDLDEEDPSVDKLLIEEEAMFSIVRNCRVLILLTPLILQD